MNVNERIKQIVKASGLTQIELAGKIGVHPNYLSNLITGHRNPGPAILEKIAGIGVNLNWLMTGEGEMMREKETSPQTPLQDGEGLDAKNEDEAAEIRRWRKPVMPAVECEDEEEKEAEAEQVRRGERVFRRDKRRARVSRVKCRGMMELDNRLSTRLVMLEERIERLERKVESIEGVL